MNQYQTEIHLNDVPSPFFSVCQSISPSLYLDRPVFVSCSLCFPVYIYREQAFCDAKHLTDCRYILVFCLPLFQVSATARSIAPQQAPEFEPTCRHSLSQIRFGLHECFSKQQNVSCVSFLNCSRTRKPLLLFHASWVFGTMKKEWHLCLLLKSKGCLSAGDA